VAQVLLDSGVRLVVLTACQSAMGSSDDAFGSVAAQLIRSGIDAVAAMSASVLAVSASRYAEAFYQALATGTPAPLAQERARQALYDNPRRHVYRRKTGDEGTIVMLLKQFDYSPLAIQLVLPALRERPLATIRTEFAQLLPTFVDDTATGRNHSLLASLEYSQSQKETLRHEQR
jgi:CHAT domain-containing protein